MALASFIEQLKPLVNCLSNEIEEEPRERRQSNAFDLRGSPGSRPSSRPSSALIKAHARSRGDSAGSAAGVDLDLDCGSSTSSQGRELDDADSLEKVLDVWTRNAEELMADAEELSASMDDAIRFLEASMSCMRNRLLTLELVAEIAALVMALGALVSGVFGMNLKSGLEDAPGWFNSVVAGIILAGVLICVVSGYLIQRSKQHYANHSARFGNNKFFKRFGDDAYILSLGRNVQDGHLHPETLQAALKDLATPECPNTFTNVSGGSLSAEVPRSPGRIRPVTRGQPPLELSASPCSSFNRPAKGGASSFSEGARGPLLDR